LQKLVVSYFPLNRTIACNARRIRVVNNKKPLMLRLCLVVSIVLAMLASACSKKDDDNETVLYGAWINSKAPGDTLQFMLKNNKNILRYNQSFNPGLPQYAEIEYRYKNGKLSAGVFGLAAPLRDINSFTWIEQNKKFDILGYQLYLFMSSSATHFTYIKVN